MNDMNESNKVDTYLAVRAATFTIELDILQAVRGLRTSDNKQFHIDNIIALEQQRYAAECRAKGRL